MQKSSGIVNLVKTTFQWDILDVPALNKLLRQSLGHLTHRLFPEQFRVWKQKYFMNIHKEYTVQIPLHRQKDWYTWKCTHMG